MREYIAAKHGAWGKASSAQVDVENYGIMFRGKGQPDLCSFTDSQNRPFMRLSRAVPKPYFLETTYLRQTFCMEGSEPIASPPESSAFG